MLNKEKGLNELAKLLMNELEFLTPEIAVSIMTDEGFARVNHEMNLVNEKPNKHKIYREIDTIRNMQPNVKKVLSKNGHWITYRVQFDNKDTILGYVNRKTKQFILEDGDDSLFKKMEWTAHLSNPAYERALQSKNIHLEGFTVSTTSQLRTYYDELKEECILFFITQYKEKILSQLTEEVKKEVEDWFLKKYTNNQLDIFSEEIKKQTFVNSLFFYNQATGSVLNEIRFFKTDSIFELVSDVEHFKQRYLEELYDNCFGSRKEVSFYELTKLLYADSIKEELLMKYENNYEIKLSQEIRKAMLQGGKTIRVIELSGEEKKIENCSYNIFQIGSYYRGTIENKNVQTILFGKKILFDRNKFDEVYGY